MADNRSVQYLRPEAQPIRYWVQMSPEHQQALTKLVDMLCAAVQRLDSSEANRPAPPWLFHETRTQLAFLDGTRGSGKTSLMSTLAAQLYDRQYLEFRPGGVNSVDTGSSDAAEFNRLVGRIREHLTGRVICVQPLDMEPLPKETSLFSALLARIVRALEDRPAASWPRGLLDDDSGESRELIRLRQFMHRIAQALDTNLHARRGSLDPEQYSEAVQTLEDQRLQLPRDLDRVLRELSIEMDRDNGSHRHESSSGERQGTRGRLFLIPIDDIDLNPAHCLELLQLLRTFSPPRELFFLLMGQYELVERCVELNMAAQFNTLYTKAGKLAAPDEDSLRQEVHRVAVLNLRKMIPPHARCEIPARIRLDTVLNFRPLATGDDKDLFTLGELLSKARLPSNGKRPSRYQTLLDLLLTGSNFRDIKSISALEQGSWTQYCGVQVLQVSYRRLADLWMDLRSAVVLPGHQGGYRSEEERPPSEWNRAFTKFLHHGFDIDPRLTAKTREFLQNRETHYCSRRLDEAPAFDWDLTVSGSDITCKSDQVAGVTPSTNVYRARLRFSARTANSGIPVFARLSASGGLMESDTLPGSHGLQRKDSYEDSTCCALAVLHDLRQIFESESTAVVPMPELTSERPVRLSWWGNEGEVASFDWPVPPLQTYVETSEFLSQWSQCLQNYMAPEAIDSSDTQKATTSSATSFSRSLVKLAQASGAGLLETRTIAGDIPDSAVEHLAQCWIILGSCELMRSLDATGWDASAARLQNAIGESPASLEGILQASIQFLLSAQWTFREQRCLREFELVNKWLRRISRIIQPELVTPAVSNRLMQQIENTPYAAGTAIVDQLKLVAGILRRQRRERLSALWKDGKRELWRAVNRPMSAESGLLSILDEPEAESKSDLRTDLREIRSAIEKFKADHPFDSAREFLRTQLQYCKLLAKTGDERAPAFFRSAHGRFLELKDTLPHNLEFVDEFIELGFQMVDAFEERSLWSSISEIYPVLLSVWRDEVKHHPGDASRGRGLSSALIQIANVAVKLEQWEAAESLSREAIEVSQMVLGIAPDSPEAQGDMIESLLLNGDVATSQESWEQAEEQFNRALQFCEEILKKSPGNLSAEWDLGVCFEKLGELAEILEQWDRAASFYEKQLHVRKSQQEKLPDSIQTLKDLSGALDHCAETAVQQGDWKLARDYFIESLQISRRIFEKAPDEPVAQNDLCISLGNCGDVAVELGDWSQADEYFTEALKISQALLEKVPGSTEAMRDVAIALEDCATVAEQLGKQDLAREQFEESVSLLRKVATAAHTDQLPPQIDLFHTTIQFAGFLLRTNAPAQARKLLEDPSIKKIASNLSASTDLSFEVRVLLGIRDFRMACLSRSATVREALFKKARAVFNDPELIPIIAREYSFRTAAAEFAAMESSASARKQSAPHRPSNSAKTSPKKTRRS